VTLADVYAAGGEVLMGTRRWEKELEVQRTHALAHDDARLREQKAEHAIAETSAQLVRLGRAKEIQEAELAQLKAATGIASDTRLHQTDELLRRRGADNDPLALRGDNDREVPA
jgi:circadian clock protein KaiC